MAASEDGAQVLIEVNCAAEPGRAAWTTPPRCEGAKSPRGPAFARKGTAEMIRFAKSERLEIIEVAESIGSS